MNVAEALFEPTIALRGNRFAWCIYGTLYIPDRMRLDKHCNALISEFITTRFWES